MGQGRGIYVNSRLYRRTVSKLNIQYSFILAHPNSLLRNVVQDLHPHLPVRRNVTK